MYLLRPRSPYYGEYLIISQSRTLTYLSTIPHQFFFHLIIMLKISFILAALFTATPILGDGGQGAEILGAYCAGLDIPAADIICYAAGGYVRKQFYTLVDSPILIIA
jgi:hypothetical protein